MTRRTRIYLALTDHAAVAERSALSAAIHAMPSATPADDTAMRDACARWAAMRETVQSDCASCGRPHDTLWTIQRVPTDSFGHWTVYTINGRSTVPDMSVPFTVDRLPRDAVRLSPADAAAVWHDDNESHTFGGPNVAAALRAAIAASNGR